MYAHRQRDARDSMPFPVKPTAYPGLGQDLRVGNKLLWQCAPKVTCFLQAPDVLTRQYGAAGRAASRGVAKGMRETDSLPRHPIESRGLDHRVPVGSRVGIGLVVRYAKQNIWLLGRGKRAEEQDEESLRKKSFHGGTCFQSPSRGWIRSRSCRERASPLHSWAPPNLRSKGWRSA